MTSAGKAFHEFLLMETFREPAAILQHRGQVLLGVYSCSSEEIRVKEFRITEWLCISSCTFPTPFLFLRVFIFLESDHLQGKLWVKVFFSHILFSMLPSPICFSLGRTVAYGGYLSTYKADAGSRSVSGQVMDPGIFIWRQQFS